MCKTVDAFIASEIASMELADKRERTKPPPGDGFEYCERRQATEYRCAHWKPESPWKPYDEWTLISPSLAYIFRCPIAKPAERIEDVGEGYEPCASKDATECRLYGDWRPVAERECEPVHHFQWRRPKKVEPKLPTVKAPEGQRWHVDSVGCDRPGLSLIGSSLVLCSVPANKARRDAMVACVAAFDEANGTVTVEPSGSLSVTGVVLRNGESLQLNTVYK